MSDQERIAALEEEVARLKEIIASALAQFLSRYEEPSLFRVEALEEAVRAARSRPARIVAQ